MENDDLILIADFLADSLTADEKAEVETRLAADTDFAALYRQQKEQLVILRAMDRAAMKKELSQQYASYQQGRSKSIRLWTIGTAVAATILSFFLVRFILSPKSLSPEQQALAYLTPYSLVNERGGDSLQTELDEAYELYRNKEYEAAIDKLEKLHDQRPDDDTISLSLAESYSQLGRYAEAIPLLTKLARNSPFQDAAQWRLALNQLLLGQSDEAKTLLEEISGMDHYRSTQADTLLRTFPENE